MSDERELLDRLATIDATPRPRWVAELRADLDAAWDTEDLGDLDSRRRTTVTLVEDEPALSEPSSGRRWTSLIVAAAAVIVVVAVFGVFVAFRRDDGAPADQPSPTVTVTLPPAWPPPPRALPELHGGQFPPGTYFVDQVSGTPTPRIFATLGAGWWDFGEGNDEWLIDKLRAVPNPELPHDEYVQPMVGYMAFSRPATVFADACHWEAGTYQGSVTTLDGLVAALTEQRGWAEVTAPSDISVDGYPGKAFQRTAPTDMSHCSTRLTRNRVMDQADPPEMRPDFRSWRTHDDGWSGSGEPGQIETLWVLDLDGTLVVITTGAWPEPSAGASPDFANDVLDSIRIDPA